MFLYSRLSEYITEKTPDETPDIPNLEQQYRPATIADMLNKIYQNVWPTAYEIVNAKFDDEKLSCVYLCNIVKVLIVPPLFFLCHGTATKKNRGSERGDIISILT